MILSNMNAIGHLHPLCEDNCEESEEDFLQLLQCEAKENKKRVQKRSIHEKLLEIQKAQMKAARIPTTDDLGTTKRRCKGERKRL